MSQATFPASAAIAGVYEHPSRFSPNKTEFQIMAECAKGALDDAGLKRSDVDGLFGASMSMGLMGIVDLAEYLDLRPDYTDGTNIGGSSFVAHVTHAAAAIHAGLCSVALVLYGSTAASNSMAIGTGGSGGSRNPDSAFSSPYGMTTVGSYAMYANLHMDTYGTSSEQLAEMAVTMRKHASLNPHAKMRSPISTEDVLGSRMISRPLHLLDCCLVTDAGGAVVLTSLERARNLKSKPVRVLGSGEAHTHRMISQMPDLTQTAAAISGKLAFERAGLTHADIDVAGIYDSFTITVLLTLESLGFCGKGEGGAFVEKQRTAPGGDFPMNTQGGALSYTHPGMFGIFTVIEGVRQVRGECGPRQVPDAKIALCNGTGGVLSSTGTIILGRD